MLIDLIQDLFCDHRSIQDFNHVFLCLIPKKKKRRDPGDFHPFSLCNVINKILAKILANQISIILPNLIDKNQGGFLKGRGMTSYTIVAFELLDSIRKCDPRIGVLAESLTIKLDMIKAYDRLDWGLLRFMLNKLGYPSRFVHLCMACVSSSSISILVNGTQTPTFSPSRGVCQGDPLSSHLFLLCVAGFTGLVNHYSNLGVWRGIQFQHPPLSISHMLFVDDLIIFAEASFDNIRNVLSIIELFCQGSGQRINVLKSWVFLP